jgi:chromosomal replication initiation ATPase DnaA
VTADSVIDTLRVRDLLDLAHAVCRERGVTLDELCGRARSMAASRARQELWWRMRHHPERFYSFQDIGRIFGRDHSTIAGGIAAHQFRLLLGRSATTKAR